ncbi:MAG: TolC family protein, partial [Thermoanaerobaculia bacterium]|nr:TolC family protein [Thermoanaerobaculia bacterium]
SSIRDRFETGLIVESDLLAAEVQRAEFRQQEITAQGNLAVANARLRAVLNLPAGTQVELASDLPERSFRPLPLEEQLRIGIENHPELRAGRNEEKIAALDVRKAWGRYLPRLDGFATYAENGDSFGEDASDDQLVGLRLSLSVFEPGRVGAVAEANAAKKAASAGLEALENEIIVRITQAWEDLQAARQRLDVAERSLSRARESVRIVRDRYEEGLVTITEQLRAQTAVTRAELNHLAALHDTTIGYARLLRATGRLEDVEPFLD